MVRVRVELQGLDSQALTVDLTPHHGPKGDHRYVRLREATALKGALEQTAQGLQLSNVSAERVLVEAIRLVFGTVLIEMLGHSEMSQLGAELVQDPHTSMSVRLEKLSAPTLRISVGGAVIAGRTELGGAELEVKKAGGQVRATVASIADLDFRLGDLSVTVVKLHAAPFTVGWGDEGLSLCATQVTGHGIVVRSPGFESVANGVQIDELNLRRGEVFTSGLRIEQASVDARLNQPPQAPESDLESDESRARSGAGETEAARASSEAVASRAERKKSWIAWELLDQVNGRMDVDVGLDADLPVMGRRRAVHQLRLQVEQGRVDFRALESDLSALEDALLDFSVRDDSLVLELGIPLLPTRGMGKPLVRWQLQGDEVALARSHRLVRLATLVQPDRPPTTASGGPSRAPETKPSVQLRALTLRNVEAHLSLPGTDTEHDAWVRSLVLQGLKLSGELVHMPESSPEQTEVTTLTAEADGMEASLDPLPLGERVLDCPRVTLGHIRSAHLHLRGLRPAQVKVELSQLAVPSGSLRIRSI